MNIIDWMRERVEKNISLILFFAFSILYFSTRSQVHNQAEDAWLMTLDFTYGTVGAWLHPHHLLYGVLAHFWWLLFIQFITAPAIDIIASLNCLLGALAAVQIYRLGVALEMPRRQAGWAAAACGLSFAVWWLAGEVEASALALLAAVLAARYLVSLEARKNNFRPAFIAGIILTLAATAHIFLSALIIPTAYILLTSSASRKKGIVLIGIMSITFAVGLITLYAAADIIAGTNYGMARFLLGEYQPGIVKQNPLFYIVSFAVGFLRSLLGLEPILKLSFIVEIVSKIFSSNSLTDEIFLARHISHTLSLSLLILSIIIAVILASTVIVGLANIRYLGIQNRKRLNLLLVTFAALSAPIFLLPPSNNEHYPPLIAVLFLILALVMPVWRRFRLAPAAPALIILIGLAAVNGLGAIRLMQNPQNDLIGSLFKPWENILNAEDVAVVRMTDRDAAGLEYITGVGIINLGRTSRPNLDSLLERARERNGRLWFQTRPDINSEVTTLQEFDLRQRETTE